MQQNIPDLSNLKSNSLIDFNCPICKEHFTREVKYVKRKLSNGQQNFCCSTKCGHSLKNKIHQEQNTIKCKNCNISFVRKESDIVFCSVSCSNKYRKHSEETKQKISIKAKENFISSNKPQSIKRLLRKTDSNLYCTIVTNTCKNCNTQFSNKTYKKYCKNCKSSYAESGRSLYRFKFSVYDYPNIFDLENLHRIGWKSRRGDMTNPNGYTRDHKVSVSEALKNNYDPFYITHPLNCELMLMSDNQRKNANSSITYEELVSLVDAFESNL